MVDVLAHLARRHAAWLAADPGDAAVTAVDGTLVFADVSGFTALSELLARQGKVGAEQLTEVVNAVVAGLLAAARPYGGDLLKYGGDALLLLFEGDGHPERGAAAAWAMQAAMARAGRVRAGGRTVGLRMSVGVETGTCLLHLVGEAHREMVVGGEVTSEVVGYEHGAEAGEVLVGPVAAGALDPACLGAGRGRGRLLVGAPAGDRCGPPPAPAAPVEQLERGLPDALRRHVAAGRADGEHRQACIAFVQHRGCDDLAPGDAAAALHHLVSAAQRACDEHGVTFLSTDVDAGAGKLILAAGAPTTRGDDEDRLLAAARATVAAGAGLPLSVRAGAHRGRVFSVEVGDAERRVVTVLGDAVNLAARVMGAATPGTLLATDDLLARASTPYRRTPRPPFSVKGKTDPVHASEVGDAEAAPSGPRAVGAGPLVGRRSERAAVVAAATGQAGAACAVELVGPAGIGKTRLLAEAFGATAGRPVLYVEGAQHTATAPYRAVREPLRALVGRRVYEDDAAVADDLLELVRRHTGRLEPLLPLLALPFGVHLPDTAETAAVDPAFRRQRAHAAVADLLVAVLPPGGALLVEDAHLLDEASGELLSGLLPTLGRLGWGVVAARRPDPSPLDLSAAPGALGLELGPLDAGDARALATSLPGARELAPEVVDAVVDRSGGNPLFLRELVAAAVRGTAVDELPDDVEAVIAAHVDAVPPAGRRLLRSASVLGSRFPEDLLVDLVGGDGDRVAADLEALPSMVVAEGDGQLRFAHDLLRQVAYEGLSYRRRRELHGRAGDLIVAFAGGGEAAAEPASLHFSRAGRHREAWTWSLVAARRAATSAAPREAIAFYDRALAAARHLRVGRDELRRVHEQVGDLASRAGAWERGSRALKAARRLAEEPVDAGRLLLLQGGIEEARGRYGVAARFFTLAERSAGPTAPPTMQAEVALARATLVLRQGRQRDALRLLEWALALGEEVGSPKVRARAAYLLDWALSELGRPRPDLRELAVRLFEDEGNWAQLAVACNNGGAGEYLAGRWPEALALYRRSRDASARVGDLVQEAITTINIGEILLDQGHLGEAGEALGQAADACRLAAFPLGQAYAGIHLGRLAAVEGRLDDSGGLLERSAAELRRLGATALAHEAEARQAERLVHAREADAALGQVAALWAGAERPADRVRLHRVAGVALAQAGRTGEAVDRLGAPAEADAAGAPFEAVLCRLERSRVEGTEPEAADLQRLSAMGVVRVVHPPLGAGGRAVTAVPVAPVGPVREPLGP